MTSVPQRNCPEFSPLQGTGLERAFEENLGSPHVVILSTVCLREDSSAVNAA